jgi:LMBR1 domain-containing protein 1
MDVVLIIMIVVVSLLLIYVNVYLLALYCHPDDAGFGTSCICKILVVNINSDSL